MPSISRAELHSLLTDCLLGDSLAADLLLCHLISRVHLRRDSLVLGKFSLNLFNVPFQHEGYCKRLATVIQMLATKSHYMQVTVDNFNKVRAETH